MAKRGGRKWADGKGDGRLHVIEDISFSQKWVYCRQCAVKVDQGGFTTLEAAWDTHRGVEVRPSVRRAARLANDRDVSNFLAALDGGGIMVDRAIDLIASEWRPE